MEAPKIIPQEQVLSNLEAIVKESIEELENVLIPQLKHGEAKRLLIAVLKYPQEVADFSGDKEELIRAYSASKSLKDAMISLGVEVVIDGMIRQQVEAQKNGTEEVPTGETNVE